MNKFNENKKIILTTDFSTASSAAYPYAKHEAKNTDNHLTLLHVLGFSPYPVMFGEYPTSPIYIEEIKEAAIESAKRDLHTTAREHFEGCHINKALVDNSLSTAESIIEYANKEKAGLIIMASQGHGMIERILLGSVAEKVLRNAPCPILLIPSRINKNKTLGLPYKNIIFCTDLSEDSESALPVAEFQAIKNNAALTIVNVIEQLYAPELLRLIPETYDQTQKLQSDYEKNLALKLQDLAETLKWKKVKSQLLEKTSSVSDSICKFAESNHADLIVLASKGRGASSKIAGHTAERVYRSANCPILLIPSNLVT